MRRLIKKQIDNICYIYSNYNKLGLLTWPRTSNEIEEFNLYSSEVFSVESNFNKMLSINKSGLIKNLVIIDLDNTFLIYDSINTYDNNNFYNVNKIVIDTINSLNQEETILVIATNHTAEDVRPIFKRSVDKLLSSILIKPNFIISNIGYTSYDYKSYILMLFISKLLVAKIINLETIIYQYDSNISYVYGVFELLSQQINYDAIQHAQEYHGIGSDIVLHASKIYQQSKIFYVNKSDIQIMDSNIILSAFNHDNSMNNNIFNNLMPFHFPCYLLLSA